MFGNRYVNYGGPGGVRRGLIWQSANVDPCEVGKQWPEWTNPGFINLEAIATLCFNNLTYAAYKSELEASGLGITEEDFYSSRDAELEMCINQIREHLDQTRYNGAGDFSVYLEIRPVGSIPSGARFMWRVFATVQHEIKGDYSTITGGSFELKGNDDTEHRYMTQMILSQWLIGFPPYEYREEYSDDPTDGGQRHEFTNLSGYGNNHYGPNIPNCVVSPCPISHWIGNNVDIHY